MTTPPRVPASPSTSPSPLQTARATVLARQSHRAALASSPAPPNNLPPSLSQHLPLSLTLPLSSLTALLTSRNGTHPPLRVTQLDASLLDTELSSLLTAQAAQALKYWGDDGHMFDEWAEEVAAGVRGLLWWLGCWRRGTSYGGVVQGLGMVDGRGGGRGDGPTGGSGGAPVSAWQKVLFGVGDVGGGYAAGRWEGWMARWREGGNSTLPPRLPTLLTTIFTTLSLSNTLLFLLHGRHPTLLHRALRIRLSPLHRHSARDVSFEYLNRQLVWHAFTEFLLFLLPLVGVARWRRWIGRAWRNVRRVGKRGIIADGEPTQPGGKLAMLPERTCGICWEEQNIVTAADVAGGGGGGTAGAGGGGGGVVGSSETDVTNPYEGVPCGCVYCYVCLAGKLEGEEGEGWVCLRCGEVVREGRVWRGDVVEEKENVALDSRGKHEMGLKGDAAAPPFKTEWAQDESDSGVDVTSG